MSGLPPGKLTDRLRGIYKLPVDPAVGPLDGKTEFTREFFVPPIQHEAAARIEELEAQVSAAELSLEHNLAAVFVASGAKPPEGEIYREVLAGLAIEATRKQRLFSENAVRLLCLLKTAHKCWCPMSWKPDQLGHTDLCVQVSAFFGLTVKLSKQLGGT